MIVWVDDLLFKEGARDVDRLALLRGASLRRHTMVVSPDPGDARDDRKSQAFDQWKDRLPERLRNEVTLLRERLDRVSGNATARGAGRLLVSARPPHTEVHGCWVTMNEAVRAVALPTHILVENAINDRAFMRRMMPPAWRERLDTWERDGLLRYVNAGGNSEMAKLVELCSRDDHTRQMFGLPSKLWQLVHVVVYDHDGRSPDRPGEGARDVERACMSAGLEHRTHRLHRRDQEHYLPPEALRKLVELYAQDDADREQLLSGIDIYMQSGEGRHFADLPRLGRNPFFKNAFEEPLGWSDEWFLRDGAWAEMTLLAEKIATAI